MVEIFKKLQQCNIVALGLALLTLSYDKNWDSHSQMNGYPSFYASIALVAPSPGLSTEPIMEIFKSFVEQEWQPDTWNN